jgi:hypothetical protein
VHGSSNSKNLEIMFNYTHEVIDTRDNQSVGCFVSKGFAEIFANSLNNKFGNEFIVKEIK